MSTMKCPECQELIRGKRGKQKVSVLMDHLIDSCPVFSFQVEHENVERESRPDPEPGIFQIKL